MCAKDEQKGLQQREVMSLEQRTWGMCFADMRRNHENSPCAEAAPSYFDLAEASTQCSEEDSTESCKSKRQCKWTSRIDVCSADEYNIYYGIKNFADKVAQVSDQTIDIKTGRTMCLAKIRGTVRASLRVEYTARQSSDNFTWQSLLDYRPSIESPTHVEQLVCNDVVALWSGIIAPQLYCLGKYESAASDCNADPLCVWSTDSDKCEIDSFFAGSTSGLSARKVLTDSLIDGIDKKVVEAMYTRTSTTETKKCKRTCIWNPVSYSCKPRKNHIAPLLTKHAKNSTDALCTYLDIDGSSQCYTLASKRKCKKNDVCDWSAALGCEPKEEFYISAAAGRDGALKQRYRSFKKRCSKCTTAEACREPNDLSSSIKLKT